jgi:signal peptidase II
MPKHKLPQIKWNIILFAITIVVIAIDQTSKWWIQSNLYPGQSVPVIGFFYLTYAQNSGAAFSIFYGKADSLAVVSIIGSILILVYNFWFSRYFPFLNTRVNKIALGLLLGGTIGNLIDRLWLHYVRDFLDVGPWPIFNAADSAVVCGVIIFAVSILFSSQDTKSQQHR